MNENNSGFTLVEVMIALLIFMFGVMGVLGMQATAIKGTYDASLMKNAVFVGSSFAEEMRLKKFSDVQSKEEKRGLYTITSTITPTSDVKQVDLVVKWDNRGVAHSYNFYFILVNPDEI